MAKSSFMTHKFWMGFNGFVLLFLAVNIGTVGVEVDSSIPFLIALGYLVYMFIYLSRSAMWKLAALFSIAGAGILFYLGGIIFGYISDNLLALAWTHIVLSLLLAGGALAHFKMRK
ncbi:MAG: hypothetical protein GY839_20630 [candidate division Zixibacteria bacterium]|nr:hypothetical protein [candidate division Zixibacteria bacterium]